jgi:radical SAM protein with 4Fe4S-binding SPASM domain
MKTHEVIRFLDQIGEAGCLWLLLTGGEPLLRDDFLPLYLHAKKKGFLVTLFTNGTLITPDLANRLADWKPHSVEITLYGATRETYERVTEVPGSYARCVAGIDLLLERKIPLALKTMVMSLNRHELFQMKAFAEARGVKFRFDPLLNARLDGGRTPCNFRLSPEEVVKLDLEEEARSTEWKEFCKRFIGPFSSEYLFSCGAGVSSFHVDPKAQMSVCQMAQFRTYDLRAGNFEEGWGKAIPEILDMRTTGRYLCGHCDLLALCGQCPGWAWMEHGNPQAPVDYLCRVAQLRAEAFDSTIPRSE